MRSNAWKKYNEQTLKEVYAYNEGYKEFMSNCKTERECVQRAIESAKKKGYQDIQYYIDHDLKLKPGDKVYANNRGKTIALFVIGKEDIQKGIKILGAHMDSPRLDIKQVPLYEKAEMAYFETHYYGGIKKYQWVTVPLSMHGVIVKKDGTSITIQIGEKENDPVFGVSDILIHLSREQMNKNARNVIEGEDLNLTVGSIPLNDSVKDAILKQFKEKYNIEEDDFTSAELECVPAGKARDYGFDRSMVFTYGQDDKACVYTSLTALLEIEETDRTICCYLCDKEETGSNGNTGSQSHFFEDTIAEIAYLTSDHYHDLLTKRCLKNSVMISSDVSMGFDANYPSVFEKENAALMGYGICFNKYTGSGGKSGASDANAEYIAKIRNIMDQSGVSYQFGELGAVDAGGGGTIAKFFANLNTEVIDAGIPVQNMHAPYEVTCKVDIYEAYKCYIAFLKNA